MTKHFQKQYKGKQRILQEQIGELGYQPKEVNPKEETAKLRPEGQQNLIRRSMHLGEWRRKRGATGRFQTNETKGAKGRKMMAHWAI